MSDDECAEVGVEVGAVKRDRLPDPHAGHVMPMDSAVAIPYAFPKAGAYRLFVQVKRAGQVMTGAFDVDVR